MVVEWNADGKEMAITGGDIGPIWPDTWNKGVELRLVSGIIQSKQRRVEQFALDSRSVYGRPTMRETKWSRRDNHSCLQEELRSPIVANRWESLSNLHLNHPARFRLPWRVRATELRLVYIPRQLLPAHCLIS